MPGEVMTERNAPDVGNRALDLLGIDTFREKCADQRWDELVVHHRNTKQPSQNVEWSHRQT